MRIEVRDEYRRRVGRIHVDPVQRPTLVMTESKTGGTGAPTAGAGDPPREVFLKWDSALDDAGQLRRCVVCGRADLFREKAFPQVTALVVVLAFVGAVVGTFGLATDLPVLILMAGVLVLDVAILVFSRRRLVCYACRSSYHNLPIARYHRDWDRSKADRYPQKAISDQRAAISSENVEFNRTKASA